MSNLYKVATLIAGITCGAYVMHVIYEPFKDIREKLEKGERDLYHKYTKQYNDQKAELERQFGKRGERESAKSSTKGGWW